MTYIAGGWKMDEEDLALQLEIAEIEARSFIEQLGRFKEALDKGEVDEDNDVQLVHIMRAKDALQGIHDWPWPTYPKEEAKCRQSK